MDPVLAGVPHVFVYMDNLLDHLYKLELMKGFHQILVAEEDLYMDPVLTGVPHVFVYLDNLPDEH